MMKRSFSISCLIAVAILQGCFYDKEELVYPQQPTNNCDTTTMTYTAHIQPIISAKCGNCHTGANTSGINLGTYATLRAKALDGKLMDRLTTNDPNRLMPQGGPKLPACEIDKIRAWVNRGAPQ